MSQKKLIFKLLFTVFSFVFMFYTYIVFLLAYFNKGKAVTIFLNWYGEADIELLLLLCLIPIMVTGAVYILKND